MNWLAAHATELFRWYLRKFPLRDGKTFFYDRLHARLAPRERLVIAALAPGFRMQLDLQDPVQRKIYFYGDYDERYEARMVQRVLDPGEVFWDIGANIGYFTLLAASVLGNTGQVVAFEPGSAAYRCLQENIALNPYRHITSLQLAVTDQAGEAVLYQAGELADGGASLYGSGSEPVQETVKAITLDDLGREMALRPPDFLKIDVEGAELSVLRGAAGLIAAARPLILLEMKETTLAAAGASKAQIQDFLKSYGYLAAFPHRRRWYSAPEVTRAPSRNILWFAPSVHAHRAKAARLPVSGSF